MKMKFNRNQSFWNNNFKFSKITVKHSFLFKFMVNDAKEQENGVNERGKANKKG